MSDAMGITGRMDMIERLLYEAENAVAMAPRDAAQAHARVQGALALFDLLRTDIQGAVADTRRDALLFLQAHSHAAAAEDLRDYFEGVLGYDAPAHHRGKGIA
jgi:hypothetical protein